MTTTNTITITPLDEQPLLFTQEEEVIIESIRSELSGFGLYGGSGNITRADREVEIEGESKWEADELFDQLVTLSKGRRIVWAESWDDEDGGSRERAFEDTTPSAAKEWVMVSLPADYFLTIRRVREALANSEYDADPSLIPAIRDLLDTIDPEVKR